MPYYRNARVIIRRKWQHLCIAAAIAGGLFADRLTSRKATA